MRGVVGSKRDRRAREHVADVLPHDGRTGGVRSDLINVLPKLRTACHLSGDPTKRISGLESDVGSRRVLDCVLYVSAT